MGRNPIISEMSRHESFLFFIHVFITGTSCGPEVWRRAFAPSSHLRAPSPTGRAELLKLPTGWILYLAIIKVSRPQWRLYVPLVTPGGFLHGEREGREGGARSLRAAASHPRLPGDRGATGTRLKQRGELGVQNFTVLHLIHV